MCKTFGVFFFINWSFFAVLSLYVVRRKSSLYIENSIPCQTDTYIEYALCVSCQEYTPQKTGTLGQERVWKEHRKTKIKNNIRV